MTQWMEQLLWQSFSMSVITLAYYVASVRLEKRYAARWFYLVGTMLLIGFLIPLRPTLIIQMEKAPDFLRGMASESTLNRQPLAGMLPGAHDTAKHFLWAFLFIVWLIGAAAVLLYQGIKHFRFVKTVRRWSTEAKDAALLSQFQEAKRALGLDRRNIGLAHCDCIASPMLLWMGRPMVLLPRHAPVAYDTRLILLHELIHCKRKDLLIRAIMLLSTAMHWFNPVIYLLVKRVTLQCEISCDDKVVENQDLEGRHQYALSIIGAAHSHSKSYTLLSTFFTGGKKTMKRRISSIYEPAKTKLGALMLASMLLLTLLAGTSIAGTADTFNYTLPDAPVRFAQTLDSYRVTWEPIDGIKEYHIGMYHHLGASNGEIWVAAGGWIGENTVTDNEGVSYTVQNGCWESITLPGNATEVELSEMINAHSSADNGEQITSLEDSHLLIVAVRESGEPIQMDIEIPVA